MAQITPTAKPRRWGINHVRREPVGLRGRLAFYHVRLTSDEDYNADQREWEVHTFMFSAPAGQGPAILRRVVAAGRLTSSEVFDRACSLGSPDFAQQRANEEAGS
jgi:hypothetical protein